MPLTPGRNAPHTDIVYTPKKLAKRIIKHFPLSGVVLDPCKGKGAFYKQFPENVKRRWCEIELDKDFLKYTRRVSWIVSNPPWSKMRAFLLHSFTLSDNIVFLAPITHFTTKARLRDMKAHGYAIREFYGVRTPKNPWPQSGFQLVACHIQKGYKGSIILKGVFGK